MLLVLIEEEMQFRLIKERRKEMKRHDQTSKGVWGNSIMHL